MLIRKNGWGKLFVCLMLSLFLGLGSFMMPAAASAADISVTVTGDGVESPMTFTLQDLQELPQVETRLYSSINTWPSKKWYMGEGPRLIDILKVAGISDEAKVITVRSRDGYKMTFTRKELLEDPRYYFPGLMETGGGDGGGHLPGSPLEAERVDAIIALKSTDSDQANYMNDLNAPLLIFGQRWVTEQTNHAFAKCVSEIEVSTATPEKWTAPTATPEVGIVPPGTGVKLESPFNDADKAYYTIDGSDPCYESLMYNWIASRWWSSRQDDLDIVNHPIEINSDTTIKAVTIGLGREDSNIVTFEYIVPFVPAGKGDTMVYVDGKSSHTVALKNDGTVWAWGDGHRGKLGDGKTGNKHWRSFPQPVEDLTGVTTVAPGYDHNLALKDDGTVWAWGGNSYGQLGNGSSSFFEATTVPEQVYQIADVQAIAAGEDFSLAVKKDGTVWSWGKNDKGQLGNNTKTKSTVAGQVYGLTNVQAIAAGKQHSLALKNDGTVWSWGYNAFGQLGNGDTENQLIPVQVYGLTEVKAIAASPDMSYAVKNDGTLWGWGHNSSGQLGPEGPTEVDNWGYIRSLPVYEPFEISGITDVKAVAAGQGNVMVLQNDGTVLVWGGNLNGEFGNGEKGEGSKEPIQVCGPEAGITMINAGVDYMMAVKEDGTAWAWGDNGSGKLGNGTTSQYGERLYPTQVKHAPPEIAPAVETVVAGEAVELVFTDDVDWREYFTSIMVGDIVVNQWGIAEIVDNKAVNDHYRTVDEGKITLAADVFTAAGDYAITVKSAGYADSVVELQVKVGMTPELTADTTNNIVGSSIELTFAENEDWANAIAEVLVNDTVLTSDQYSVDPGQLIIDASALDTEGEYTITVKATGYQDAVVTQLIKGIPVFTIEGNAVEEVAYTMAELQAMDPTTDTYTSKNGDISCTGVTMADLLTALDITDNSLQVQINTTDAATYPVDPVTVVDMLNTENRYLLTYEIDGEPITGDDTALRMYWSGKVIKNVTGITVTEPATEPTTYTVTFTVTPPDAAVVVKDIEGNIVAAEEDGTYNLDTGEYNYTVSAEGYVEKTGNFTVIGEAQTVKVVLEEVVVDPDEPRYNLIPAIDTVYSIGETADGIKTMTVNSNQSGFKYFTVSIEPVVEHEGTEVVVFTHLRDKAQLQLNATEADFDIVNAAKAGFNVNPGDVIKAYVVDQLTNETTSNPLVMQ